MTIGWLDCSAGASGDMLLGAIVDAGVSVELLQAAVDGLRTEPITLRPETVVRAGLGATRVHVDAAPSTASRSWADISRLLDAADLAPPVRGVAVEAFGRLAAAEAAVHRVPVDEVHFHELGGLDTLADVVGVASGLQALGLTDIVASWVALGSGSTRGLHGPLPVPAPAVLELLRGAPVRAGAGQHEMTTPTGAALLATVVTGWGELPAMRISGIGVGAGGRDPAEHANVLRLVLGDRSPAPASIGAVLLETNVDDLDPRVWPSVLQRLLELGADDAWLTPILMKKGRPAHQLSVLCRPALVERARELVVMETSSIGVRLTETTKMPLDRVERAVTVDGHLIRVKVASLEGVVVNANPEYEDVAAAAAALGRPVKGLLAAAAAAAQTAMKKASTPDEPASGTATTS